MTRSPLACIVLAAGKGTRMKSDLPKVLHPVAGRPMVGHVLAAAEALRPDRVVVVIGPGMETVAAAVAPHAVAVQAEQRGTADAVRAAAGALAGFTGDVLVVYGDTPLVTPATLERMIAERHGAADPAVVVLGMEPADPTGYGRLIHRDGRLEKIVEHLDATPEERRERLCNAGLMAFDGARLWSLLDRIGNDNAKGEFYLTDIVQVARAAGHACGFVRAPSADEVLGVNSRAELAAVEKLMQQRLRRAAMDAGATLTDPDTVHFCFDTKLGRDVTVGPNVVFGPGVTVADRVEIRPFCHLEGVTVAAGAQVGPFARLRPGAEIGPDAHIGNFVEIKNAAVAAGAKVNHLSYIGDATVGAKANIGAGTITCNYDGFFKHHTEIGEGAFIGSNTALVAPVTVGAGAIVGAGSVITDAVAPDDLAVARGRQQSFKGWAKKFRERKKAEKAAAGK